MKVILKKVLVYNKVTFYSAQLGDRLVTEFKDFTIRAVQIDKEQVAELFRFIQNIGQKYGAAPEHFKKEDNAERLPPPYYHISTEAPNDYGLRLYCIRLTTKIVILLNGDKKSTQKVQDCKNCKKHFMIAKRISKCIDNAIRDNYIELKNFEIQIEDDFELTI